MGKDMRIGAALLAAASMWAAEAAWARQNIVIGELSVGYDYQDRNYTNAQNVNRNEGNTRSLSATPRIRYSTQAADDLLEFAYAPSFTYDDAANDNFIGQSLNLLAEKSFSREWMVRATESYFSGEDSVSDYQQRTAPIIAAAETPQADQAVGAGQVTDAPEPLTEVYGRRRYWRNDFGLRADHTYAPDSVLGFGYGYGVLRNDNGNDDGGTDGYTDYDRQEESIRLGHRFDIRWKADTEFKYVQGDYKETDQGGTDDDLKEYIGRARLNYAFDPHNVYFGLYAHEATDYEDPDQEDSTIHTFSLGWDHDFSRRLRMSISAGPTLVTYDTLSSESGYNAYAGLTWAFPHASLTVNSSYNYEFDNFDGRRTGLTKNWNSGLKYTYRFTPEVQTILSSGYVRSDHQSSSGAFTGAVGQQGYIEETYDAGVAMSYSFLRWYTFSASYRYADHSEPGNDYDEHRVLLSLGASTELIRW